MPQLRICCKGDKLTLLDTVVNGYLLELHVIDSCLSQSWYDLRSAHVLRYFSGLQTTDLGLTQLKLLAVFLGS